MPNSSAPDAAPGKDPFLEAATVCSGFLVKLSHEIRIPLTSILA